MISIVVPVHNEQESLPLLHERISKALERYSDEIELLFVDDGSSDHSCEVLKKMAERDRRIRILVLSKNFGQWAAITAGLHHAKGDAVAWISSDLQDPPEILPQLIAEWERGADVVWGVRSKRKDSLMRRLTAKIFYGVLRRIAIPEYPMMGTDLCLMSRRILQHFKKFKERSRFTQGLIMNLGFRQAQIPYERDARRRGRSKWNNLEKLVDMSMDMLANSSARPLRWMLYLGLAGVLISGLLMCYVVIGRFVLNIAVSGWASVMLVIAFFGGINTLMLGILGEYVWRILAEAKERPLYIIQEKFGYPESESSGEDHGSPAI